MSRFFAVSRRDFCAAGLAAAATAAAPATANEAITQPEQPGPEAFMARAFVMRRRAEAAGDQAYGAVVVREGRIVGEAPSAVVTAADPTAHAEMQALRDAVRRSGGASLAGATLYSTSRPCPMCEAAAYRAGVARMIHGADLSSAGAPRPGPAL